MDLHGRVSTLIRLGDGKEEPAAKFILFLQSLSCDLEKEFSGYGFSAIHFRGMREIGFALKPNISYKVLASRY